MVTALLLVTGAAFAGEPTAEKMSPGNQAVIDSVQAARISGLDDVEPRAAALEGYIWLTSHTNGGSYECVQGDQIYVSSYATDADDWGYYQMITGVWDNQTQTFAELYVSPDYVYLSKEAYAVVDTTGLQPSVGRYTVMAILWDDLFETIEDAEEFNLAVRAPGAPIDTVTAAIGAISPNPASFGQAVTFSGYAGDSLGHGIVAYEWRSSMAGVLSNSASFSSASLPSGSHTIYFRAMCANGVWSPYVSTALSVTTPVAPPITRSTTTRVKGPSSVKAKKTLKLTGTVSPSTSVGRITIVKTRLVGNKWKSMGSAKVKVVDGKYQYSFKPAKKGKWRFVAEYSGGVSGTTTYRASKAKAKTVRVR